VAWYAVRNDSHRYVSHVVLPLVGIAVLVWVLVAASAAAQIVGAVWLAAGLVTLYLRRSRS
jgi:uncharacterized membrane protein HdeD (DUF308 family)